MKKKTEYLLLAAVIMATVSYLMLRETNRTRYQLPKIPDVNQTDFTRIEIDSKDKSISLVKKEERWYVLPGEFPADKEKVASLLDTAAKLSITARVSESKNYARYDLTDEKKIITKAYSGEALKREFDIGSTASTFRHTHIKIAGDPNIYQALGNIKSKFDQSVENLRDLTVLSFQREKAQELSIHLKDQSLKILKKQRTEKADEVKKEASDSTTKTRDINSIYWETAAGKTVDSTRLNQTLAILSNLKCQKFIPDQNKDYLTNPEMEIIVRADAEHTLRLFKKADKDAKEQPGMSSNSPYPFFLADHQIQEFLSLAEDLIKGQ